MRCILIFSFVVLITLRPMPAGAAPSDSGGVESLGNELLEGLAPNSFDPAATQPLERQDADQPSQRDPVTRAPRFDDLGEDIGKPPGSLSLTRVRQGMQHAQALLGAKNSASDLPTLQRAGQVQQDVVTQLDKLIAELSQQCKNCNSRPGGGSPKPSQRTQNKPGNSSTAAASGRTAARDSTDRLASSTTKPVEKRDFESVVKDLWGHLPERSREQMMQSFSEEFLPKYELEIEQYYRRLSEEND